MLLSKVYDNKSMKAEDAIGGIGLEFQRLRVKRGERLEDIAAYLGFKSLHLYGLEQGDLSTIPNRAQVHSIISRYANYLGLDGVKIMARLTPVIENLEGTKAPSGFWNFAGLDRVTASILSASVVLGVFTGWSFLGDMAKVDLIAPPVTAEAVTDVEPDSNVDDTLVSDGQLLDAETEDVSFEAEQALANLQEIAAAEQKVKEVQAASSTDDDAALSSQEIAVAATAAVGTSAVKMELPANVLATLVAGQGGAEIFEPENTDARVIVRALSTSWIQVSSRDRTYLWTRTMQPKEMLLVPNRNDLELWAGDASGIEVLLDGSILPSLGPPGTVIRGVSLKPDSLAVLSLEASGEAESKPTF